MEPDAASIESGLVRAIDDLVAARVPSKKACYEFAREAYNWRDIAERTIVVYDRIVARQGEKTLERKVRRLWESGRLAGPLMACLFLFCHYWILVLDWLSPL